MGQGRRPERVLAIVAGALGLLALIAGDPRGKTAGGVDVQALAREVEREEDHVDAIELARWIRDRKAGLRVIDLRSAEDYAEFSIPGSQRFALTDLTRAHFDPGETVVLYSEGGPHAAQGWFFLRARGIEHVYFLRGGLYEWINGVIDLKLASDASPAERQAYKEAAELSRYFGGQPSVSDQPRSVLDNIAIPTGGVSDGRDAIRRVKRRGC